MSRTLNRFRPALLLLGCTLMQSQASAHFVWVEPGSTPTSVKVCFGEYPEKEGSPLLEKIERVRAHALVAGARRELKGARQPDHYLFDGMAGAPVAVALLDYGILERPGTPPFLLRYEGQLIRGEGKPLSAADLGKWSRVETGLPLAATITPAPAGKIALQITLEGKPVQAEVTRVGSEAEQKLKTSPKGRLELPLGSGMQQLRIMAQDVRPARFEGKQGQFTRTYLSLMFEAAESAGSSAADNPVRLLHDAHEARANWGKDFPGFSADARFEINGRTVRGKITVGPDYDIKYDLGDREMENAIRPSFASLIMHRRGGSPTYQATWKDSAGHPLGRAINLNDEHKSFYRVRDRQILQVNRSMGSQRFTNNVFENEETKFGFLPRLWNVAYYDNQTNALIRVSTTRVTWTWAGDAFMPATLDTVNAHAEGTDVSRLTLSNHRLLK